MRGAFGKPQGVCARVSIGQILLSIRCKDAHAAAVSVLRLVFLPGIIETARCLAAVFLQFLTNGCSQARRHV
jgi:hypothetical protein